MKNIILYHIIYKGIKPENILLTKVNHIQIANFKTLQKKKKKVQTTNADKDYISPEIKLGKPFTLLQIFGDQG